MRLEACMPRKVLVAAVGNVSRKKFSSNPLAPAPPHSSGARHHRSPTLVPWHLSTSQPQML